MTETTPEATEPQAPKIIAAAAFGFDESGSPFLSLGLDATTLNPAREMTLIEVRRYVSEILMDLQAQTSAEYTVARIAAGIPVSAPEATAEETPES